MTKPGENEAIEAADLRTSIIEKLTVAAVIADWDSDLTRTWVPADDNEAAMIADALLPELLPIAAAVRASERAAVAAEIADKIGAEMNAWLAAREGKQYADEAMRKHGWGMDNGMVDASVIVGRVIQSVRGES